MEMPRFTPPSTWIRYIKAGCMGTYPGTVAGGLGLEVRWFRPFKSQQLECEGVGGDWNSQAQPERLIFTFVNVIGSVQCPLT